MKRSRIEIIRESMERVVSMLARRHIPVHQRGMRAFVEYHPKTGEIKCVNLPYLPDDAGEDMIAAIQGFLDHELGHILFSTASVVIKACDLPIKAKTAAERSRGQFVRNLHNMIEDVYIERRMTESFPGSHANLESLRKFFLVKMVMPATIKMMDEGHTAEAHQNIIMMCMRAWGGQMVARELIADPRIAPIAEQLRAELPAILFERLTLLKDSDECLELAQLVAEAMVSEPEEELASPPPGEESGAGDPASSTDDSTSSDAADPAAEPTGEPSPGSADAGDEAEEHPAESAPRPDPSAAPTERESSEAPLLGSPDADPPSDEPPCAELDGEDEDEDEDGDEGEHEGSFEPGEGESTADGEGGPGPDGLDSGRGPGEHRSDIDADEHGVGPSAIREKTDVEHAIEGAEDFDDAVARALSDMAAEVAGSLTYKIFSTDWDTADAAPITATDRDVARIEDKVRPMVGVMAQKLRMALASQSKVNYVGGKRSGSLDPTALFRVPLGDDKVFRQRTMAKAARTRVTLLIDCSASMSAHGRIASAGMAAYALARTLESLKIEYEVIGFTAVPNTDMMRELQKHLDPHEDVYRNKYGRSYALNMPVFKAFKQRFDMTAKKRIASLTQKPDWLCENVDGESVRVAARRLLAGSGAERHLMLVLSDGEPCCPPGRGLTSHLRETVKQLSSEIEIVGIGIQTEAVKRYYPRSLVLNQVSDLPTTVVGELSKMLLASAPKH